MQQETLAHEGVHAFFSPRSGPFMEIRQNIGQFAYDNSGLVRGLEEMMAEGYAQYRVTGSLSNGIIRGFSYPFALGYVSPGRFALEAAGYLGLLGGSVYYAQQN